MNLDVVVVNALVVVGLGLITLLVRARNRRSTAVDLPASMRPSRPGQELANVVTEWALATGVLTGDQDDQDSGQHSGSRG